MTYTILSPRGPKPPYGSFAGKPASGGRAYTQTFTILGPRGPQPPHGSFAGKVPGVVTQPRSHPFFATHGQLMHR